MYVHLENQGRPEEAGWRDTCLWTPRAYLPLFRGHGLDLWPRAAGTPPRASPEHLIYSWMTFVNILHVWCPRPLQLPVPGALGRQQVTLIRTQMGWRVGTVASVSFPSSAVYHPLWPSHGHGGISYGQIWPNTRQFLPRFSARTWSWTLFPPDEELTTYLEKG